MHVRIHHEHEGAGSVRLIEGGGKAMLSVSQCSLAAAQQFSETRKSIYKCFVSTNPPLLPAARLGVYGRKHEVQERLETERKGSIRDSLSIDSYNFSSTG